MTSTPPHSRPVRSSRVHLMAAVGLAGAGALWLLHYPLRPSCPQGYVHFDLGIPAAIGVLCLLVAAEQAFRVWMPSRLGVVAGALVVLAALIGLAGAGALYSDLTGSHNDCWTF